MGDAKKSGRTLHTDFAFTETGPDSNRDTTFLEGIELTRVQAGLADGALRGIEILEWDGPGGGWPYIKLTFDTQESLVRWSWVMWDGHPEMLDLDLGFSPQSIELVEPWFKDADALQGILDAGPAAPLSKYERRCLVVIVEMIKTS